MDEKKPISFLVACKQFFGLKPGQGLSDFRDEVKKLDAKDEAEMRPLLSDALGSPVTL